MGDGQENSSATGGAGAAKELLDTAFSKIQELGAAEPSHLFPNGISLVDLQIELGADQSSSLRLALKLSGATAQVSPVLSMLTEEDDTGLTFDARGHRVIAMIAMNDLTERLPDVAAKLQQILDDGERDLGEAATFPDVIRNSQPETKPFHFIDIPFKDGGPANPGLPPAPHVLSQIEERTEFFRNGGGTAQENVDAVSWLIHMFGDIHQPLHCIEHISSLHPNGDRGGNSFRLKGSAQNLHHIWDSSVSPFGSADEEELAVGIAQEHTRESLVADLGITEPEAWARASFKLAKQHAYKIKENPQNLPKPSTAYLKNMEKIGRRQAALAGYRLADRLAEILP